MGNYERALRSEDWKFLRDCLLLIRGEMAIDMFSKTHTKLGKEEKDVVQKTYYNIDQMIAFLLEPKRWVSRRFKWKQQINQLKSKVKPS